MLHNHNHFNHVCFHTNLGHCAICDTVYCKDCGKEWKNSPTYNYLPYQGSGIRINPGNPTITCSGTAGGGVGGCNHT